MKGPTTILATTVARLILPFLLLFSLDLMLAGHNRPGGGFIAGVMVVAAIALQYVAFGAAAVRRRLPRGSLGLAGMGLALALASGLSGILAGEGFLKSWVIVWSVPLLGQVKWATAFFFDLGIFLLVIGAGLTTLTLIAEDRP
jgi:multisubunit Na+/H+ antiporter MnhB subunit